MKDQVLNFWFKEIEPKLWWVKDDDFDQLIRDRFGGLHKAASACELYQWRESPEGRLAEQMNLSHQLINDIPGLSCTKPKGALYLFPKIDIQKFNIKSDEQFVLDFLKSKQVLLVHGRGFNWRQPDHFRLVFLPHKDELRQAIYALGDFLESYSQ